MIDTVAVEIFSLATLSNIPDIRKAGKEKILWCDHLLTFPSFLLCNSHTIFFWQEGETRKKSV